MRYGILGDVHSNLEALETAIKAIESEGVDVWMQVGDVVGYGPDPVACINLLRELDTVVVAGNHDEAVTGRLNVNCFNQAAKDAVIWTRAHLGLRERDWLKSLPLVTVVNDAVTLVHSSPNRPHVFDYIMSLHEAEHALGEFETPVCFIGHSHEPASFLMEERVRCSMEPTLNLKSCDRALINVGSVGQPRDENPDTAFGIYDDETCQFQLFRRAYDIKRTARKIVAAGLPSLLADRLFLGL